MERDELQGKTDDDQIRILGICHFVFSAIHGLFFLLLFLHYYVFSTMVSNPEMFKGRNGTPFPPAEFKEFFKIFVWFYAAAGLMIAISMGMNFISGWSLMNRTRRTFSIVAAGLNCLQMPLGTILGVFTLVVVMRDSVRESYARGREMGPVE